MLTERREGKRPEKGTPDHNLNSEDMGATHKKVLSAQEDGLKGLSNFCAVYSWNVAQQKEEKGTVSGLQQRIKFIKRKVMIC